MLHEITDVHIPIEKSFELPCLMISMVEHFFLKYASFLYVGLSQSENCLPSKTLPAKSLLCSS